MPNRIYMGSHPEVEVPLPDGSTLRAKRGESTDVSGVPEDVLKSLDEQDTWLKEKPRAEHTTASSGKE